MNLIELYIGEVTRRLPEKSREDIALELRSTIEDMLPDDYTVHDVKEVLAKLGNPAILASGYKERPMHLIGPRFYDLYIDLLKLILPIAVLVSLIAVLITSIFTADGGGVLAETITAIVGNAISASVNAAIQVLFWLTVVFAIIERADHSTAQTPLMSKYQEWTPDDLKETIHIPKEKRITKYQIAGSLIWTAIWSVFYFNADSWVGVYRNGELIMPTFNQEVLVSYWLLVALVIVLEIALSVFKWREGQWTVKLAVLNAAVQAISTIVFVIIFTDATLFNNRFLAEVNTIFDADLNMNWAVGSVLVLVIVFALVDIVQGFQKARIQEAKRSI
ncbi:hypothetical protein BN1080_00151 [Planococcus massiliensis]|uniref:Uncharacterized protein n=1 Tax=Planococcus massiliensis TaxID=1499687 RepID=A0A098EHF3_9BACL|nr:hypothetical protein [Planococcus massiliensis]CEG21247.1 hypothetical protein BN1080_00151 [Planococcus massiliensis]